VASGQESGVRSQWPVAKRKKRQRWNETDVRRVLRDQLWHLRGVKSKKEGTRKDTKRTKIKRANDAMWVLLYPCDP
jgi:hypothetical protein